MRGLWICAMLILVSVSVSTQRSPRTYNPGNKLFIITLDGFRWEELFNGADSAILNQALATPDAGISKALYWDDDVLVRRKRLMPFFWSVIAGHGQLYGNRLYDNKVNVSNPYALSYPGYSELLTGNVDFTIHSNSKKRNPNPTILEMLNQSSQYAGKVAAFASWDVFPYILNAKENQLVLNSGFDKIRGTALSSAENRINELQARITGNREETRYDELTYIACQEYIIRHKPSVVFLSFSGTDNAGHQKRYDHYLQQANNADRMIGELWRLIQSLPEYAGHTTFVITTDHGRGSSQSNWHKHGIFVAGSYQTWLALLGNGIVPAGEMKGKNQLYQKELKELMKALLARQ